MGRYRVRFKCHHCGHCCKDVVCLPTPWDVIRIVEATLQNPRDFLEFLTPGEISEVEEDDPTWLECNGERYIMALRRDDDGCHFIDPGTRKCTVYPSRPILCRLYPFRLLEDKNGAFKGFSLHKDVGCPRHRDGIAETTPLHDLYLEDCTHHEAYNHLVEVFNRRKNPKKRPEDFIDLFVTGF